MKFFNALAVARMDSTSALLASLPETFTSKEFNAIREKKAREDSGMYRSSLLDLPRTRVPYSLNGLREIGVIVIAFSEPIQMEVKGIRLYEVFARSTGESLLVSTAEECEKFVNGDWRNLGTRFKGYESREITVQRHHYSVDYEAYRTYIQETFGAL